MLLSARMLNNVRDANTFDVTSVLEFNQGDNPAIYFQLVDSSVLKDKDPPGQRYCPIAGAAVIVTLKSVYATVTIVRNAVQAFPTQDGSIWYVQLIQGIDPIEKLVGTYALKLDLVQNGVHTLGYVPQALNINSMTPEF